MQSRGGCTRPSSSAFPCARRLRYLKRIDEITWEYRLVDVFVPSMHICLFLPPWAFWKNEDCRCIGSTSVSRWAHRNAGDLTYVLMAGGGTPAAHWALWFPRRGRGPTCFYIVESWGSKEHAIQAFERLLGPWRTSASIKTNWWDCLAPVLTWSMIKLV